MCAYVPFLCLHLSTCPFFNTAQPLVFYFTLTVLQSAWCVSAWIIEFVQKLCFLLILLPLSIVYLYIHKCPHLSLAVPPLILTNPHNWPVDMSPPSTTIPAFPTLDQWRASVADAGPPLIQCWLFFTVRLLYHGFWDLAKQQLMAHWSAGHPSVPPPLQSLSVTCDVTWTALWFPLYYTCLDQTDRRLWWLLLMTYIPSPVHGSILIVEICAASVSDYTYPKQVALLVLTRSLPRCAMTKRQ